MEIFIERIHYTRTIEVYCRDQKPSKDTYYHYNGNSLEEITANISDIDTKVKPLFSIPEYIFKELLNAFVNEGKRLNIQTENENHLKGKLEATENHLNDLQLFTKKLMKIE